MTNSCKILPAILVSTMFILFFAAKTGAQGNGKSGKFGGNSAYGHLQGNQTQNSLGMTSLGTQSMNRSSSNQSTAVMSIADSAVYMENPLAFVKMSSQGQSAIGAFSNHLIAPVNNSVNSALTSESVSGNFFFNQALLSSQLLLLPMQKRLNLASISNPSPLPASSVLSGLTVTNMSSMTTLNSDTSTAEILKPALPVSSVYTTPATTTQEEKSAEFLMEPTEQNQEIATTKVHQTNQAQGISSLTVPSMLQPTLLKRAYANIQPGYWEQRQLSLATISNSTAISILSLQKAPEKIELAVRVASINYRPIQFVEIIGTGQSPHDDQSSLDPVTLLFGSNSISDSDLENKTVSSLHNGSKLMKLSRGTLITEFPNGSRISEFKNGTKVTTLLSGVRVTRLSDGKIISEFPHPMSDKQKKKHDQEIIRMTELSDSRYIVDLPDGTRLSAIKSIHQKPAPLDINFDASLLCLQLPNGDSLLETARSTQIPVCDGFLQIRGRATLFSKKSSSDQIICNMLDEKLGAVSLEIAGKKIHINPGTALVISAKEAHPLPILPELGIRNVMKIHGLRTLRAYSCEFSIPSALHSMEVLKHARFSAESRDKILIARLMKMSVILAELNRKGSPYERFRDGISFAEKYR